MLFEIRDVTKIYDSYYEQVHALDGVSFDVAEGVFIAFTGASGSGKPAFFRICDHAGIAGE